MRNEHGELWLSRSPVNEEAYKLNSLQEHLRGVMAFGFSRRHKLLVLVEYEPASARIEHIERLPEAMQR